MGRIFETRKHTMFARWDKMSKQFARIGKEITWTAAGSKLLQTYRDVITAKKEC